MRYLLNRVMVTMYVFDLKDVVASCASKRRIEVKLFN